VIWNSVLLGFTEPNDITVSFTNTWVDKMFHQTGEYIPEAYFNGQQATIQVDLSEINNWDNWIVAFPMWEKQIDTDTPPNTRVVSNSSTSSDPYTGTKASTLAQELILRPVAQYADVSTEKSRDFVFPKAWVRDVGDVLFQINTSNALSCTFGTLFDPSASDGEMLAFRGLETATGSWSAA